MPEQLGVGEFDPRACVAVVVEHVDAGHVELGVERIGRGTHLCGLVQIERYQYHMKRSDRIRPDDSPFIMILFNRGRYDARHTDAVTAHQHLHLRAGLVQHRGIHRGAVLASELEYVPHLDAPHDPQAPVARGAGVPRHDIAQVGGQRLGQVPAPVDPGQVGIAFVGTANEIGQRQRGVVRIHGQAGQSHRTEEARWRAAGRRLDFGRAREPQRTGDPRQFLRLHGVELVIAP